MCIKYMINNFKQVQVHFSHTVKWFHLFLYNMNTQLNDQTVLFQTIQFSISTQLKCQTVLFDS